ncbi:MAG: peroxiredoxin [Acidobacteriia bacterium]|nr:peroxiredoxin [Terriglobia bacterium]MBV8905963.1 peroxiredoxin [Terriglobia bacterium]
MSWFSDPLAPGTPAPDFSLPDESGRLVTLSALKGKNVVLVFYPGDDTPGCTRQLCAFRDQWDLARKRNVELYGINPQSSKSHEKFRRKFQFPFPLLVDEGQRVAKLYNASGLIIKRTVYLIDPNGLIRFAQRGSPKPAEVLSHLDN